MNPRKLVFEIGRKYRIITADDQVITFKFLGAGPEGLLVEIDGKQIYGYQIPPFKTIDEVK